MVFGDAEAAPFAASCSKADLAALAASGDAPDESVSGAIATKRPLRTRARPSPCSVRLFITMADSGTFVGAGAGAGVDPKRPPGAGAGATWHARR